MHLIKITLGVILIFVLHLDISAQTGFVGIGIDTPSQKLHIQNGNIKLVNPSRPWVIFDHPSATLGGGLQWWLDGAVEMEFFYDGIGEDLRFWDTQAGVPRMILKRTGNLGIGVSNPTSALEIEGQLELGEFPYSTIKARGDFAQLRLWSSLTPFKGAYILANSAEFGGPDAGSMYLTHGDYTGPAPASQIHFRYTSDSVVTDQMLLTSQGHLGIGPSEPLARLHVQDSSVLFTGEFNDTDPVPPPIEGAGTRMMWYPDKAALRSGIVDGPQWDMDSIGYFSFASGFNTISTGDASMAAGSINTASGDWSTSTGTLNSALGDASITMGGANMAMGYASTALGWTNEATGDYAVALGAFNHALRTASTALGSSTQAFGEYSTSMGLQTHAQSYASVAIGRYNQGLGTATSWVSTDALFEIGRGTSSSDRRNALTVLKNGNVGIDITSPVVRFHVTGGSDANLGGGGYFQTGLTTSENILLDNNEIMCRNNGSASTLYVNNDGGNVILNGSSAGKIGIGTNTPSEKLHVVGGMKVDGTTFNIDETNNRVGIGTSAPNKTLHVYGPARFETNSSGNEIIVDASSGLVEVEFQDDGVYGASMGYSITNDRIYLYHGGNVFVKNGSLGIGIEPTHKIHISGGAYCDGGTWVNGSSRNIKSSFVQVDPHDILERLCTLPITEWNYKTDDPAIRHIGPVAEDFHDAFGLGSDHLSISTVDIAGVSVAAIQALHETNIDLRRQNEALWKENARMKDILNGLISRIERLENQ